MFSCSCTASTFWIISIRLWNKWSSRLWIIRLSDSCSLHAITLRPSSLPQHYCIYLGCNFSTIHLCITARTGYLLSMSVCGLRSRSLCCLFVVLKCTPCSTLSVFLFHDPCLLPYSVTFSLMCRSSGSTRAPCIYLRHFQGTLRTWSLPWSPWILFIFSNRTGTTAFSLSSVLGTPWTIGVIRSLTGSDPYFKRFQAPVLWCIKWITCSTKGDALSLGFSSY